MPSANNTETHRLFYILVGEQQKGPLTTEGLRDLRYRGDITPQTLCWEQGTPDWVPFERIAFEMQDTPARPLPIPPPPPALETRSEGVGYAIALAPIALSVVVWFYAVLAGNSASQSTFHGIVGVTILVTNFLMMFEAYKLGMGKPRNGKRTVGPVRWLLNATVLWIVGIPCYLYARRKFGKRNLALLGSTSMVVFVISLGSIGSMSEERESIQESNAPLMPGANSPVSERARNEQSLTQIKKVYYACRLFAGDNDGNFPRDLHELVPDYLDHESLSSPLASTQGEVDYLYAGGTDADAGTLKQDTMLWKPGHADWVPADRAGIPDQGLVDQVKHPSVFKKAVGFVFGAACILWCIASILVPIASDSDGRNGPVPPSGTAMPLTRENIFRYNDVMQKPLQDAYRSSLDNDLTKPIAIPQPREDSRFPKAGADVMVIKEMGYSYNLTMRAIAQHKGVLSQRIGGDIFLMIGGNAAHDKAALRNAGLIDQDTYQALAQAFSAE